MAATLGFSPALAEAAASADTSASGPVVGEVLVTARRQSEDLQKTPVSVTAVSGAELLARSVVNISDVAQFTPNMLVSPSAATKNAARITIRGQVQNDNLITLDPSVGVYVDDVYFARTYSALTDLLDVADVEVLKGPQGTLYGRNTTGGAVKVTTRKPGLDESLDGYVKVGAGNFQAFNVEGAITVPLIKDMLALRYAGSHKSHSGYTTTYLINELSFPSTGAAIGAVATGARASLTPVGSIDTDDLNSYDHRLTVVFRPIDKLTFTLAGSLFTSKDNGSLAVNTYGDIGNFNLAGFLAAGGRLPSPIDFFTTSPQRQGDFYSALSFIAPFSKTTSSAVALTTDYEIANDLRTKFILSYSDSRNHSRSNTSGFATPTFTLVEFAPDLTQSQHQVTAEWQFTGKAIADRLNWIGGLYYFKEIGGERQPATTRVLASAATAVGFTGNAQNESKSAYANAVFKLTDRLDLNGGIRYTQDDKQVEVLSRFGTGICVFGPGAGIITSTTPGAPCELDRSDQFNNTSWELGADYRFTDDIYGYAKANTGYRSGGQQLRAVNNLTSAPFGPEHVQNYEAGLKTELFERRVRVNVAVYHTDYKDIQQSLVISPPLAPTTTTEVVNQGNAKVDGIELEAVARITEAFTLSASGGYTDFKYDDPTLQQVYTPKWKGAISAVYVTPTPIGVLNLRADYNYTDAFFVGQTKALPSKLPSFKILNARAAITLPNKIELAVWARNLTEEKYYTGGVASADVLGSSVGAPRTYGVDITYPF